VSLSAGARLGPYEVVSLLGSGGMGEVYRARDPRLGRDIAIKVLPSSLSADSERMERFEQEARAAAALNHPNILAVYDLGTHDGAPYIVSELLEGETLRERLQVGQAGANAQIALPVRKAVEYAIQVAHGLAAAHEKGIIHRDLKPENLFVTIDGRVKILDFGLAKLTQVEPVLSGLSAVPTTPPNTVPGVVLGTIGYMSPEQARGVVTDHRTDIFAFGTILYELLSGHRAFVGETTMDVMTAIVKGEPPDLPISERGMPPALVRIVDRCLQKAPAARFQSAGDLAFALEALSTPSSTTSAVTQEFPIDRPTTRGRSRRLIEGSTVAAVVLVLGAVAAAGWLRGGPPVLPARFSFDLPHDDAMLTSGVAVSPDGRSVVVPGTHAGMSMLYHRAVDQLEVIPIRGTEDGAYPFFSPDGKWIGFFTTTALKKVPAEGGPPSTIVAAGYRYGATWGSDGTIVFAWQGSPDLLRVSAAGGKPAVLVSAKAFGSTSSLRWPHFVPDGSAVLFTVYGGSLESARIAVHSLKTGQSRVVMDGTYPVYVSQLGQLVFARGASLWAVSFDIRTLTATGSPIPVLEGVQVNAGGLAPFNIAAAGTLVYRPGGANDRTLTWINRQGIRDPVIDKRQAYLDPALSPDGRRIAVSITTELGEGEMAADDIWVYDIETKALSRVTFGKGRHLQPVWVDSRRLIYAAENQDNVRNLFMTSADGTGKPEQITRSAHQQIPTSVTADGTVIFTEAGEAGRSGAQIWTLKLDGDRKAQMFLQEGTRNVNSGRVSPDGRWLAYRSDESGRYELYVRSFLGTAGKWQISTNGANYPFWSPDGRELLFFDGTSIESTQVSSGLLLSHTVPQTLFQFVSPGNNNFSPSRDGQRFLTLVAGDLAPGMVVAVNWLDEVKARLGHK
jgi:serine/threonine protein kinase/Tol biopolymer transport system component